MPKTPNTWLLVDSNYLCHRAWHTTGGLKHGDIDTGVVFGFLREIVKLQDVHNTNKFVFCFDGGKLLRKVDYPPYKERKPLSEEDKAFRHLLDEQIAALREKYLYDIGYKNVFSQAGYEADDLIGATINVLSDTKDHCVIVSADHDMYQLLGPRVRIWNPRTSTTITEVSFSKQWGISPIQWIDAQAIAGCTTDNIAGVVGVGEKTACKFLNGTLNQDSTKFAAIVKGNKLWKRNRHLVRIPYPGAKIPKLQEDTVNSTTWQDFAEKLGMFSVSEKPPPPPKKKKKGFIY